EHPPRHPFRLMPAPCEVCGRPALPHKRYPHLAQFYCGKTCKSRAEAISSDRKGSSIQICCAHQEADMLEARLNFAPPEGARAGHGEYRWSRRRMRTATLFDCPHSGLAVWMLEQFGQHADGKRLPTWVLTMPEEWR